MNPSYPLYIVSKGRWDSRITAKYLDDMGVPYSIVVEEQEYPDYAAVMDPEKLLILDPDYKRGYDTFDDLGDSLSKGPGAARNFAWDHSIDLGFDRHWVLDDNIRGFFRLNKNMLIKLATGSGFRAMEDFVNRYTNVAMAGPQYYMFAPRKNKLPPFVCNTRIYSCNLIMNDAPYRWRGRYNEDTDLSLRMLKDGYCTIQFNAFLQYKMPTQTVKGGNNKDFYEKDGTLNKSIMQVKLHPDVSRLVWRFGRWHHYVDYDPFKNNKLIRKGGLIPKANDEYGMELVKIK
jgi:hypothetical protein